MVGEFSFDYGATPTTAGSLEQFHAATVEGVNRLFNSTQGRASWFNTSLATKTAFALDSV